MSVGFVQELMPFFRVDVPQIRLGRLIEAGGVASARLRILRLRPSRADRVSDTIVLPVSAVLLNQERY